MDFYLFVLSCICDALGILGLIHLISFGKFLAVISSNITSFLFFSPLHL